MRISFEHFALFLSEDERLNYANGWPGKRAPALPAAVVKYSEDVPALCVKECPLFSVASLILPLRVLHRIPGPRIHFPHLHLPFFIASSSDCRWKLPLVSFSARVISISGVCHEFICLAKQVNLCPTDRAAGKNTVTVSSSVFYVVLYYCLSQNIFFSF